MRNIPTISPSDLKEFLSKSLDTQILTGEGKPLFIWGLPGVGKTSIITQWCEEMSKKLGKKVILRVFLVATIDIPDVQGLPVIITMADGRKFSDFAAPAWLPVDENASEDTIIVLFFDEFNLGDGRNAAKLQAAFGGINRYIGTHKLADNVFCIAAGNPGGQEGYHTDVLTLPLNNRFMHVELVPTLEDFVGWLSNRPYIDPRDVATLTVLGTQRLGTVYNPNPTVDSPFASPRSWAAALHNLPIYNLKQQEIVLNGTVGSANGAAFLAMRSLLEQVGNIDSFKRVINGEQVQSVIDIIASSDAVNDKLLVTMTLLLLMCEDLTQLSRVFALFWRLLKNKQMKVTLLTYIDKVVNRELRVPFLNAPEISQLVASYAK